MHLNDERKPVYYILALSAVFLFVLLILPISWRTSAGSHSSEHEQYIGQDEYVIFNEPEHHDNHHEDGGH